MGNGNMKVIYKGKTKDKNGYAVHLFYEYRGHEYMITDEHNGYSQTMAEKHHEEQNKIDEYIKFLEEQKEQSNKEFNIDEIFEILERE